MRSLFHACPADSGALTGLVLAVALLARIGGARREDAARAGSWQTAALAARAGRSRFSETPMTCALGLIRDAGAPESQPAGAERSYAGRHVATRPR